MTNTPKFSEVYLDANFLIAYFISPHPDYVKAQKLMAKLLIDENNLVLSVLTIDETMNGIKRTLQQQESVTNLKKGKNHKDYISDIRKVVDSVIDSSDFKITQFDNPNLGCMQAVNNIDNYTLRPRDAFHLSYMQDQNIQYIATNDKDFDKVSICNKIEF